MNANRFFVLCLLGSVLSAAPSRGAPPTPEAIRNDEAILTAAKLGTDGPALLELFRRRILTDEKRNRIRALIRQLGDDDFDKREQAEAALVAEGALALPLLRSAPEKKDPEVRRRLADCIPRIEAAALSAPVMTAAARLLAARKPEGTVECLLACVPSLDAELVTEEIELTLSELAVRDGRAHPALLAALADPEPLRRGVAVTALCKAGLKEQRPALVNLLRDPDSGVRLKAADALAQSGERAAVVVLIELLGELPRDQAWRAEELLYALAGDKAPAVSLGTTDPERARCRDAWTAWWKKDGAAADLTVLTDARRTRGFTLVTVYDATSATCTLIELGPDDKERWRIEKLDNAVDAAILPGDRVLIAEYNANRITERNFKGEILWEFKRANPCQCQRLRNGNTFVATQHELLEVDPAGKVVFELKHPVSAARKFPDGTIGLVSANNKYSLLDAAGKELKSFPVNVNISNSIGGVDFLPGGRLLVGQAGKLVEYDAAGKIAWEAKVPFAGNLMRLPNGHTLIVSLSSKTVDEVDAAGKMVRQIKLEHVGWQVKRR